MANERKTEEIVRELFRNLEYPKLQKEEKIFIEEQGSENPEIQNLLKTASKNKLGKGIGKPEFIIWSPEYKDFIVIIECKADSKFHETSSCPSFAPLHYLKIIKNVILNCEMKIQEHRFAC